MEPEVGISSRFRQRRKVDLPQPEGPMRAVMLCYGTDMVTWCSAWVGPYHRFRSFTVMISLIGSSVS